MGVADLPTDLSDSEKGSGAILGAVDRLGTRIRIPDGESTIACV